jgi:hypothetical protein
MCRLLQGMYDKVQQQLCWHILLYAPAKFTVFETGH